MCLRSNPDTKELRTGKTTIRFQNWRRSSNWAAFFSPVGVEKNMFVLWWLVIRDQSGLYDVLKPLCLCIESIWYSMQKTALSWQLIRICSQKIIMDSWDFIYFFTKTISVKVSVRKLSQSFCSKDLKIKRILGLDRYKIKVAGPWVLFWTDSTVEFTYPLKQFM